MSKKYLFVFSLFVFVFNIAFISKAFGQNYIYNMPTAGTSFIEKKCTSNVLVANQECIAYTVAGFTDSILIGTYDADANQTLIVHQDQYYPDNRNALFSQNNIKTSSSTTCNSPDDAANKTACQLNFTHNWGSFGIKDKDFITHDGTAQSNVATYQINIQAAPITILGTINGSSSFLWTTLDKDKTLNIQCTNSLSMKINGQEVATGSAGNGYTINYNFKDQNPKGATYTVVCSNVGTSKSVEFNTLDMTGNLSAQNCKIPLGESKCSTLLAWSTQNALGSSEVTSPWPSAGTVVGNTNNGNKTVEIPHGSRKFYLYNSGSKLDEIEVFATCDNSQGGVEWDGTKCSRKEITTYLEAAGCIIPANASSCNGEVSWSITNSTTTVGLYKGSTLVSSNISGNNLSTSLPYGNTYFYLKHGGVTLKTSSTSAVCTSGTTWDGSKCALPAAAYTLTASTCTIASGGSSCTGTVTWKVTNPEGNISLAQYSINNPPEKTIYTGDTGTNKSTSLSYGQNSFTVKSNNTAKKTVEVSVACASGSTWSGSVCVPNSCPPERWNEASGACMTGAITLSTCSVGVGAA